MNFKRSTKTLCIFCMVFLFVQCEKKEMFLTEGNQPDAAQNLKAKKPKPPKPDDPPSEAEYVIITGSVTGEGLASTSVREYLPGFTLTLSYPFPPGTHNGEIRILYGTKKKSENRIDFRYEDSDTGDPKALIIRAETNTGAYDPETSTMTLVNCYAIIAERDGTGENYTDYTPASATVVFTDTD